MERIPAQGKKLKKSRGSVVDCDDVTFLGVLEGEVLILELVTIDGFATGTVVVSEVTTL